MTKILIEKNKFSKLAKNFQNSSEIVGGGHVNFKTSCQRISKYVGNEKKWKAQTRDWCVLSRTKTQVDYLFGRISIIWLSSNEMNRCLRNVIV